MKKLLVLCFSIMLMLCPLFLVGCGSANYIVDYGAFNSVVVYGEELSLVGLSLKDKNNQNAPPITITQDMIVECDDLTTVGEKQLKIVYNEKTLTINFAVKYKVDFMVDGLVYDTQYVFDASEIKYPDEPILAEHDFVAWDKNIPTELDGNMRFDAMLTVQSTGLPKLSTISAVYGDKLSDITLPYNAKGKWEFCDVAATVGDAGTNEVAVKFVPTDSSLAVIQGKTVTIKVARKTLTFDNVVDDFVYDGKEKQPSFELSVADINTTYMPYYVGEAVAAGSYDYEIEISDPNYQGSCFGTMVIAKQPIKIEVSSCEIDFGQDVPKTFDYAIKDNQNNPLSEAQKTLLGLNLTLPEIQHAGVYEIEATIDNDNFDVTLSKGYLTVKKVKLNLGEAMPTFAGGYNITYGDSLQALVFENTDVRGAWSWKSPETQVLTPTEYVATAIFSPKEDKDYLISEYDLTLNVLKKVLTIDVKQNNFVYDKQSHAIVYQVYGLAGSDTVDIVGEIEKTNAGDYPVVLSVQEGDLRYVGSSETTLKIAKASLADFTKSYSEPWDNALLLQDITLQEGYSWETPLTHITEMGEQSYLATYTPQDTDNYKIEQGNIVINIVKATATITAPESFEFVYSADGYEYKGISPSHEESSLTYQYIYQNNQIEEIIDAGSYSLLITLPASEHYNSCSKTVFVEVKKADNQDVLVDNIASYYLDTLSMFDLPQSDIGTWSWKAGDATLVGNAGSQKHIAKFTPSNANYNEREVEITFIVNKKVVQTPIIDAKTYSGAVQTADLQDTTEYTVLQNAGGTDIGKYDVVVKLKDSANYRWAGVDESDSRTLDFYIHKNANNYWVVEPYIESFVYGRSMVRYMAEPAYGIPSVMFTEKTLSNYTLARPTNVGDYLVRFVVEETENYNGLTATLEFSITHITVDVPVITDLTYTGASQAPTVAAASGYTVKENAAHTAAGTYSVSLELIDSNHKWSDGSATLAKEIAYKIKMAENSWEENPTISGWTYTPNGGTPGAARATFGEVSIKYKEKTASSYTSTLPKDAGAYVAVFSVAGTDNYEGIEKTIDFVITQCKPTVNAPQYDMSAVYYENQVNASTCYTAAPSVNGGVEGSFSFGTPQLKTTTVNTSARYEATQFDVVFNPKDTRNYLPVTAVATINLYKVAYIGDMYYGSIENALACASENDNIMVIPDVSGNVTIARNVTIPQKVTLSLPYLNVSGKPEVNANGTATLHSWNGGDLNYYVSGFTMLNLTSKLVVKTGVEILNLGSIVVAGELSGGSSAGVPAEFLDYGCVPNGYTGNTGRNYAKIVLESGAIIRTRGTITCYGYIDEVNANNGSQIIAESGKVYLPFIVCDFRGGNYMSTAITYSVRSGWSSIKKPISPFNQFEFRNIVPKLTVNYGASIVGLANIFAGKKQNFTEVKLVGNTQEDLLQFTTPSSRLEAKYNILERPADGSDKWEDGVNELHFYGGATTNTLSLTVTIITSTTVKTSEAFFPISWRQNIYLHSGDYNMNNKFKVMPGGKLIVESDANLTANQLVVYEEFNVTFVNTGEGGDMPVRCNYGYGKTLAPGLISIKGTLTATSLAGIVYKDSATATITAVNTTCESLEITSGEDVKVLGQKIGWKVTGTLTFGDSLTIVDSTIS